MPRGKKKIVPVTEKIEAVKAEIETFTAQLKDCFERWKETVTVDELECDTWIKQADLAELYSAALVIDADGMCDHCLIITSQEGVS